MPYYSVIVAMTYDAFLMHWYVYKSIYPLNYILCLPIGMQSQSAALRVQEAHLLYYAKKDQSMIFNVQFPTR